MRISRGWWDTARGRELEAKAEGEGRPTQVWEALLGEKDEVQRSQCEDGELQEFRITAWCSTTLATTQLGNLERLADPFSLSLPLSSNSTTIRLQ